jgi:AcrR family transcriptional regulator
MAFLKEKMTALNEVDIRILDESRKEFESKGYYRANIDDVAKRLNLGKGTIYRHFKDKVTLLAAVMYRMMTSVKEDIALAERISGFIPALDGYVDRLVASSLESSFVMQTAPEGNIRVLTTEESGAAIRENLMECMCSMRGEFQRVLEVIIERGKASGVVPAGLGTSLNAELVISTVHSFVMSRVSLDRCGPGGKFPPPGPAEIRELKLFILRSIGSKETLP